MFMLFFNEFGKDRFCILLEMLIFKIFCIWRIMSFWREGGFCVVFCKRVNMEGLFLRVVGIVFKNILFFRYLCCDKLYLYLVNRFIMFYCRRLIVILKGLYSFFFCFLCLIIVLVVILVLWCNNNCVVWRFLFLMVVCRGVILDMIERK